MKGLLNISIAMLIMLAIASCKKGDDYYYDYAKEATVYEGTTYEYLLNQKGVFDSLVLVLNRLPKIEKLLNDKEQNITLFAMSNRSFQLGIEAMNANRTSILGKEPLYLEDLELHELDSLTSRYIFEGKYDTEVLAPFIEGQLLESYQYGYEMHLQHEILDASGYVKGGEQQIQLSDVNNSIFDRYWNTINTKAVNIHTQNGVIHILSPNHDFGYGKLTQKFTE